MTNLPQTKPKCKQYRAVLHVCVSHDNYPVYEHHNPIKVPKPSHH